MKNFHKRMNINETFPLLVYMFWMLVPTDAKTILARVGRPVNLQCNDTSIDSLTQLTWQMNGVQNLFVYSPQFSIHVSPEARNLSLAMSDSASRLYALVIEKAQKSHTGNFTCETVTSTGVWKQEWELLITDSENPEDAGMLSTLTMIVAITVPCVCVLTFIIALTCMLTVCRHRAKACMCCTSRETEEQTEDIYENCFDNRDYIRPPQNKPRTQ